MSPEEHQIKEMLTNRFGKMCWGCLETPNNLANLFLDHIIPQHDGGADTIDNRALLCSNCNTTKGYALTLGGLRQKNRVKDSDHPINLAAALKWTREIADAGITHQLSLSLSGNSDTKEMKESSDSLESAESVSDSGSRISVNGDLDFNGDSYVWGRTELCKLLWLRGHQEIATALTAICEIKATDRQDRDYDGGWYQWVDVSVHFPGHKVEEYNYITQADCEVKKTIEIAVREITWTLDSINEHQSRFDIRLNVNDQYQSAPYGGYGGYVGQS